MGEPAGHGQRWRPRSRGRHARWLGSWSDCRYRLNCGRPSFGWTNRTLPGGWGHLIGDEGSAYGVVLMPCGSLPADGMAASLSSQATTPFPIGSARLGATSPAEIVTRIYAPGFDRSRIASLAADVLAACSEAPDIGERLLKPAAAELAEMVAAVCARWDGRQDRCL